MTTPPKPKANKIFVYMKVGALWRWWTSPRSVECSQNVESAYGKYHCTCLVSRNSLPLSEYLSNKVGTLQEKWGFGDIGMDQKRDIIDCLNKSTCNLFILLYLLNCLYVNLQLKVISSQKRVHSSWHARCSYKTTWFFICSPFIQFSINSIDIVIDVHCLSMQHGKWKCKIFLHLVNGQ